MSTLTIPQVRAWQPGRLDTAAQALGTASGTVEEAARALSHSLEAALVSGAGDWAAAARTRAATESRTGIQLADALDLARAALSSGATDIGHAKTHLLGVIGQAQGAGFAVSDAGVVTAPTLPPVLTPAGDPGGAGAARNRHQSELNSQAQGWADDIAAALAAVGAADETTAGALTAIKLPQTLESAVDAYIQRALASKDLIGALGTTGAGGVALALALKKAVGLYGRTSAFATFLKASTAPITSYEAFLKNLGAEENALLAFRNGTANGGLARFLMGSRAAKLAGKAFLPLTVLTGLADGLTGGGYDGARGWATRGMGLAGAAGGGALLASSAGLIALGPIGVGIAGAAVLGYGAWSLGNAVYDNWDDISDFGSAAAGWAGDRLTDAGEGISHATDWAGDQLAETGDKVADAAKSVLQTASFGLL